LFLQKKRRVSITVWLCVFVPKSLSSR
jgi:hypothetical protein